MLVPRKLMGYRSFSALRGRRIQGLLRLLKGRGGYFFFEREGKEKE